MKEMLCACLRTEATDPQGKRYEKTGTENDMRTRLQTRPQNWSNSNKRARDALSETPIASVSWEAAGDRVTGEMDFSRNENQAYKNEDHLKTETRGAIPNICQR